MRNDATLGEIGWLFTRYANLTLGGGSATTAVLHRELLEKRHWLNKDRFTLCYALGRLTPGTNLLAALIHDSPGFDAFSRRASFRCAPSLGFLTA